MTGLKLFAVGVDSPNPADWSYWDEFVLVAASSVDEARKVSSVLGAEHLPTVEVAWDIPRVIHRHEPADLE
jgi:hypothetical protein